MRAFLLLFVVASCGSSNATDDAGLDASTDTSSSSEASADTGPTTPKYAGNVIVSTNAVAMTYDVFGLFSPIATPPSCMETKEGACTFSDCPTPTATTSYFVAGMLDVSVGAKTIPVPKMANGEYRAKGTPALFDGGQMVTAKWTGDPMGAPAMSIQTIGASHITVNNPALPVVGVPVSRMQPFTIDWTGGTSGKVHVSVWTSAMGRVKTVACVADASAGTVTAPSSLLSLLTGATGYVSIDVLGTTTANQGEWQVTLEAHSMATDPNGRALLLTSAMIN